MSDEITRFKDFAGGTVIHVNWPSLLILVAGIGLVVWFSKRKR